MGNAELARGNGPKDARTGGGPDLDLERLRTAVQGIRYGEVRVVIQDGVIVQIERLERQRLR
jgi:hypothetical protein